MSLYALVALVFLSIAYLLFFIFYLFLPKKPIVKERLESMITYPEGKKFLEKLPSTWQKFLARLGRNVPIRPQDYGKYISTLVASGIKKERFAIFIGSKIFLAILLPVVYLMFYGIPYEKDLILRLSFSAALSISGFLLPSLYLSNMLKKRQLKIFHDLPDLLDLMTVCVEAGMGIEGSMIKVYEDEQFKKSPLADEMKIAIQETRAGKPKIEAFRDMGERCMVDDLRAFAALLIQTEQLGTSLGMTMRIFSDSLRNARRQKAEEAAAKTTVKLLFPLVFLIFPSLLIVILGPGIIRLLRLFLEI